MKKIMFFILLIAFCGSCKNAKDYHKKANLLESQNRFEEAISNLDKAIKIDPKSIDAYLDRGVDKSTIGDYQGAVEDYSSVIKIDSLNTLAICNRGKNYVRLKKLDLALIDMNKAYAVETRNKVGFVSGIGEISIVNKNDKYDVTPQNILFERGIIYFKLDSLNKAISDLNYCLDYDDLKGNSYYWIGLSYLQGGRKEEGFKNLQKADSLGVSDARNMIDKYCKSNTEN